MLRRIALASLLALATFSALAPASSAECVTNAVSTACATASAGPTATGGVGAGATVQANGPEHRLYDTVSVDARANAVDSCMDFHNFAAGSSVVIDGECGTTPIPPPIPSQPPSLPPLPPIPPQLPPPFCGGLRICLL